MDYNQFTQPEQSTPASAPVPDVAPQPPLEQKPKKNRLLFVVLAVVTLAGLSAGAYYLYDSRQSNQSDDLVIPAETVISTETDTSVYEARVSRLVTASEGYAAANNGTLPTVNDIDTAFVVKYLNNDFTDPNTGLAFVITENNPAPGEIQYVTSATCNEDGAITEGSSSQFVVRALVTDGTIYCTGN